MKENPDRRSVMRVLLAVMPGLGVLGAAGKAASGGVLPGSSNSAASSVHDFDFFLGSWTVRHRRLKKRLAGSADWEEFDGATKCQSLLGGMVNLNESVSHRQGVSSRGLGLRAFDSKNNIWADWYLGEANPTEIGVPGVGRFEGGVGTFLSDETFEGRPVKVRGRFSSIAPNVAQWEQAFSADQGKTWETNWVMRYTRID